MFNLRLFQKGIRYIRSNLGTICGNMYENRQNFKKQGFADLHGRTS